MKILSIGSDRKLFERGSAVSERIRAYGELVEEYHIVVFALKSLGLKETQLGQHVWIYPTNSESKLNYLKDATALGHKIVFEKKFVRGESLITTQDPFESGLVGLQLKKRWRLPLEVQLHTDIFSENFNGFLNFWRKRAAKKVLSQADSIRVVTEDLAQKISLKYNLGDKVFVLPIFVDKSRIENRIISFDLHERFGWKIVILSVARLTKEKNFALALEALALALPQTKDTGLVIVGEGPERESLEGLAKRLKIAPNVAFVGWQEDLASYYQTANIYLQTSTFEGYGLSLVEAGMNSLPVISTQVGIVNKLKAGDDLLVVSADKESVAQAIINLATNAELGKKLATNLKQTLDRELISKEEYLRKLIDSWKRTVLKVQ